MDREADFAIGETAVSYSPNDTYRRAIIVGLFNTLRIAQGFAGDIQLAVPNFHCVVLYLAGPGVVLLEFSLARAANGAASIEHDGARAGGSLV